MGFPDAIVECAFNNAADETLYATQGWTEITPWVKSMSGPLRGRSNEMNRSESGTLNVVLDNTDGEFTPGNSTSPYYPNIKSNRRFRVRGKNMMVPNLARGGGADHSTVGFEKPTWSGGTFTTGVSDPRWTTIDPVALGLPAELTDAIEVTVAAGTYSGFRRILSWIVPVEIAVRLAHSAYVWRTSGTEPGGGLSRFEIFYFDNDDVELVGNYAGLTRAMDETSTPTPTTPTRRAFSHAPIGVAKYARVVWSVWYGEGFTLAAPVTYRITGIQTELPANLAPNPNGDWDAMHWLGRGGSEQTTYYSGDRVGGGPIGGLNWVGFTWNGSVSLRQNIPHLIPGELYAVSAQVNLTAGHPGVVITGDGGGTISPLQFRFPDDSDDFGRTVAAGGWGTSSGGHAWTISGTAANTSVGSGVGVHSHTAVNAALISLQSGVSTNSDWDLSVDFMVPVAPIGAAAEADLVVYFGGNYYSACAVSNPGGTMDIQIRKNQGSLTTLASTAGVTTAGAGLWRRLRFQRLGNKLRAYVVPTGTPSPVAWQVTFTDETFQGTAGTASIRSKLNTGATNTFPYVVQFDSFSATKINWVTMQTYFVAGGPDQDVEVAIGDGQGDPLGNELLVRGLNVQRVFDVATTLPAEDSYPTGETAYERPKDIFEGWVERWPWKVDENEAVITVVDRLKRVGVIELANVVQETLQQDDPGMVIPFTDVPTSNTGAVSWSGSWAQASEAMSLTVGPTKGDILTSSYTLGVEGPTDEPAILLSPASNTVGYFVTVPYSSATAPPPPTTTPPPSTPPPTGTATTYTKNYYATWSRSYDSDGTTRWDDSPYLYHGCYFCSNNQRALVGFNWAAIKADLAGADVLGIHFVMRNAHARWNAGLYVNVGTHTYASKPATWSSANVVENRWKVFFKEMEKRSVIMPVAIGYDMKAGNTKGIAVGPAPSNITDNYGFFYGASHSDKPYLIITYRK